MSTIDSRLWYCVNCINVQTSHVPRFFSESIARGFHFPPHIMGTGRLPVQRKIEAQKRLHNGQPAYQKLPLFDYSSCIESINLLALASGVHFLLVLLKYCLQSGYEP